MVRFVDIKEKERECDWIEVDLLGGEVSFKCLDFDPKSFNTQKITFDTLRFEKDRSVEALESLEFEKTWNINKNLLLDSVVDWKDIEDENNEPIPFSKDMLAILFDQYPTVVNTLASKVRLAGLDDDEESIEKK